MYTAEDIMDNHMVVEAGGGGDCAFHSLRVALVERGVKYANHMALRLDIADYLKDHHKDPVLRARIVEEMVQLKLEGRTTSRNVQALLAASENPFGTKAEELTKEYLRLIRMSKFWAGAAVMYAASLMFGYAIQVVDVARTPANATVAQSNLTVHCYNCHSTQGVICLHLSHKAVKGLDGIVDHYQYLRPLNNKLVDDEDNDGDGGGGDDDDINALESDLDDEDGDDDEKR